MYKVIKRSYEDKIETGLVRGTYLTSRNLLSDQREREKDNK